MFVNYYDVLGISPSSSKKEIKRAYKSLAIKLHPDRTQNNKALEERFKVVKLAYEHLSNDDLRNKHDSDLQHNHRQTHKRENENHFYRKEQHYSSSHHYHCDDVDFFKKPCFPYVLNVSKNEAKKGCSYRMRFFRNEYLFKIPKNTTQNQNFVFDIDGKTIKITVNILEDNEQKESFDVRKPFYAFLFCVVAFWTYHFYIFFK